MTNQQYKAYASANLTVAKTKQIVMLYDAAIRYIKQAQEAIDNNDIETRFTTITKAANIMFGLQSCLDFEQGGDVAKTLYSFYSAIDARLLAIHRSNSAEDCAQLVQELKTMRDTWAEIDEQSMEDAAGDADTAPYTGDAQAEVQPTPPAKPPIDTSGGVAISA